MKRWRISTDNWNLQRRIKWAFYWWKKYLKLRTQKNGVEQKIIYSIRQVIMNWTKINGNDSNRNAKN